MRAWGEQKGWADRAGQERASTAVGGGRVLFSPEPVGSVPTPERHSPLSSSLSLTTPP